jgi:hypothetical protein
VQGCRLRFILVTLGFALGAAGPAQAAFAPKLSATMEPALAGTPTGLSLEITQASEEEATRSLNLALPGYGGGPGVLPWTACTGAAESSGSCPEASRIGTASSTTSFGDFTGGVGERHESSSRLTVSGCVVPTPWATLGRLALTPRTIRRGRATALAFTLSSAAPVRVTARRLGTRRVRTLRRLSGRAGRNRIAGLGRGLAPSRYLLAVSAAFAGRAITRTAVLRVLAPRT